MRLNANETIIQQPLYSSYSNHTSERDRDREKRNRGEEYLCFGFQMCTDYLKPIVKA
jgi:hypothetical protein